MKKAIIVFMLIFVITGMLMGCSESADEGGDETAQVVSDEEISQDLDNTVIEDKELVVGEMI